MVAATGRARLGEALRTKVANWLAETTGRRYRYLTDDGRWVEPKDGSESLPLAAPGEQATTSILIHAGTVSDGAQIEVTNTANQDRSLWIAGGGRERWFKIAPGKKAILEVGDGLLAITIQEHRYVSHVEVIQPNAKYRLELK